ncbi:hypothetical protein D9M68_940080 [compost metagenome]
MKVEPSMPPKGVTFSARPPIQKSTRFRPVSTPAQVPVPLRKSRRSAGAVAPPRTIAVAAARLPARVVAPVISPWVP